MKRQLGFTLWELLVTLLVAGVVFGIGVPNIMEFQRNSVMTGAANDLITAILSARTESVKRQVFVTWCLSDNPLAALPTCSPGVVMNSATRGFVVWVDESGPPDLNGAPILTDATDGNAVVDAGELILTRVAPPGGTVRVSANCGHLVFLPTGFPRLPGPPCGAGLLERGLLFCDDRGRRVTAGSLSSARVVVINRLGRATVFSETAVVDPWAAAPGVACPA